MTTHVLSEGRSLKEWVELEITSFVFAIFFLSFSFFCGFFFPSFFFGLVGGWWKEGRVATVVEGRVTIYENTLHMLLYLVISYSFLDCIFPRVLKALEECQPLLAKSISVMYPTNLLSVHAFFILTYK